MSDTDNSTAQNAVDAAAEHAHETANAAGRASAHLVDSAAETASNALESAGTATDTAVDAAQQGISAGLLYAGKTAAEIGDKATRSVKRHPARTALISAGVLIAAFVLGVIRSKRS